MVQFLDLDDSILKQKYESGISLREIARQYNTSKVTIKRRLQKLGVSILSSAEYVNQHKDEHIRISACKGRVRDIKSGFEIDKGFLFKQFLERANKVHGDRFDYSKFEYNNWNTSSVVICKEHGEFSQTPMAHVESKNGCPKCRLEDWAILKEEFILKACNFHGNKYDYSLLGNFVLNKRKINVICKKHGKFTTIPNGHLQGRGCPECANDDRKMTLKEFTDKALKIHNGKYTYENFIYKNRSIKSLVTCPIHGDFLTRPGNHLHNKTGCPICAYEISISSGHQELIDYIKSICNDELLINDRTLIYPYEVDIYIPSKKIAIEYNGLYWHSYNSNELYEEKYKHRNKCNLCIEKGVQLIQIFENELLDKGNIVKSIISAKLGCIINRVFARKCDIITLSNDEFNEFCCLNHIQGAVCTKVRLGLKYDGKVVCVLGFNSKGDGFECSRFCNLLFTNVVGGASRLFKYFVDNFKPKNVLTFADRRYSNGGLYKMLGFKLLGITNPNYFYTDLEKVYSRQSFQKHKLHKRLDNFDPNLSESLNMFNNGYRRLWDAGHWKFLYN